MPALPPKKSGPGPIIAIAAVAVVALLIVGVGIFLVTRGDDDEPAAGTTSAVPTTTSGGAASGSTPETAAGVDPGSTVPATSEAEPMDEPDTTSSGFVPEDGEVDVSVSITSGTGTRTVTPDPDFDLTITVNGGSFVDEYIDAGFPGDPETVTLPVGEYVVTIAGFLGSSGGFVAELR